MFETVSKFNKKRQKRVFKKVSKYTVDYFNIKTVFSILQADTIGTGTTPKQAACYMPLYQFDKLTATAAMPFISVLEVSGTG